MAYGFNAASYKRDEDVTSNLPRMAAVGEAIGGAVDTTVGKVQTRRALRSQAKQNIAKKQAIGSMMAEEFGGAAPTSEEVATPTEAKYAKEPIFNSFVDRLRGVFSAAAQDVKTSPDQTAATQKVETTFKPVADYLQDMDIMSPEEAKVRGDKVLRSATMQLVQTKSPEEVARIASRFEAAGLDVSDLKAAAIAKDARTIAESEKLTENVGEIKNRLRAKGWSDADISKSEQLGYFAMLSESAAYKAAKAEADKGGIGKDGKPLQLGEGTFGAGVPFSAASLLTSRGVPIGTAQKDIISGATQSYTDLGKLQSDKYKADAETQQARINAAAAKTKDATSLARIAEQMVRSEEVAWEETKKILSLLRNAKSSEEKSKILSGNSVTLSILREDGTLESKPTNYSSEEDAVKGLQARANALSSAQKFRSDVFSAAGYPIPTREGDIYGFAEEAQSQFKARTEGAALKQSFDKINAKYKEWTSDPKKRRKELDAITAQPEVSYDELSRLADDAAKYYRKVPNREEIYAYASLVGVNVGQKDWAKQAWEKPRK